MAPMTRIAAAVMLLLSLSFTTSNATCTSNGNECGAHGTCESDTCKCNTGYKGDTCTDFDCSGVNVCGSDGKCVEKVCKCNAGFSGVTCQTKSAGTRTALYSIGLPVMATLLSIIGLQY